MAAGALLVRLSPAPAAGEKARLKLLRYFQSARRSGGGECEVRPGSGPGTFWVHFQQEQVKKNVESRTDHALEIDGRHLKIVMLLGQEDLSKSPLAEQASPSSALPPGSALPPSSAPPRREQQAAQGHGVSAEDILTGKIFLTVSATLNTSMFTERQREKITTLCPNLKREGNPDIDGFEKLTGDFMDIEKAYHYFKDILADNDSNHDFSPSESKNGLEDENGLNTEEMNELEVLPALYEYFSHACKEEIKTLQERFGVSIRGKDHDKGSTLVCFTPVKSSASIQKAKDFFITAFQEHVRDLKQEKIPITNRDTLNETITKLNARFSNLLAKEEENQLLLRGPGHLILDAKKFLDQEGENSKAEKNMNMSSDLYQYRNGIEVDASVFKLLETILSKDIEYIEDKFGTVTEKKGSSYGQKMLITFRPRTKTFDMTPHAAESFINAFQNAAAMLREKLISLRLSGDQEKTLNMLLHGKLLEELHVKLKKEDNKLILSGLPNHLYAAEKHIMDLLNPEDSMQTKSTTLLSSSVGYQEVTGASEKKYNGKQKNNLTLEKQPTAKTDEEDKDKCPICMDRISNKETLRKCNHEFCKSCIDLAMTYKQCCPVCNTPYGLIEGNQPEGTMSTETVTDPLPGYPDCGTIVIIYNMQGGIQTDKHPNPGSRYAATTRVAYLPDNKEGQEILKLLKRAFDQKLIFTVGRSRTTGAEGVITWNDIHHKTSVQGGPTNFGYPDPDYLQRVRSELKARGIE
ncbi:E3 ubiquitin-protein ligase DTX3L [Apus apus]|uniref:E3 ubiquitin-protein ligase DTX3L n=1 Tax=Apus apus TaxID=8895 RepID=UPI0021F90ECE|nr:E3 ubiquitin-protein ligase DTX3L [Apus apus]